MVGGAGWGWEVLVLDPVQSLPGSRWGLYSERDEEPLESCGGWMWLGFNRTILADFLELKKELAGVDFPQEIGVLGRRYLRSQSDLRTPQDLTSGGSVNTPTCVEVQPTSELVHFMTAAAKTTENSVSTSAYSVSSSGPTLQERLPCFGSCQSFFCDKLYA